MKKLVSLVIIALLVVSVCGVAEASWFKGPKGDKGDTGPQGVQGIQGVPGVDGQAGIDGRNGSDCRSNTELGIGVDIILYEQGDDFGNLGDVRWLKGIELENRADFNNGKPMYKGYVVTRIKFW